MKNFYEFQQLFMKSDKEKKIQYDKKTAFLKASSWCAYQERSQQEARDKLYEWGLYSNEVDEVIAELITSNFLNEERFAMAYVSGKFNIKKWGRLKIKNGLRQKRVPEKLIQKALYSIDEDAYLKTLGQILEKKQTLEKEKNPLKRQYKLNNYLQSKGYENDLIFLILKNKDL